jgi:hypothetical protein
VLVGWPGAGKSGVLHDFAESCISEGRDVVFIAVDQIGARSLGELRNEIGLDHELIEVLLNWSGERTGILIIDALDAARADPASTALLPLIRAIATAESRWRVVASIRKYDLRYSPALQELFRGNLGFAVAPELQDPEFALSRHLNVPLFTDEELDELRRLAPGMDALLQIAPPVLQDLLRVPFNLRLMADILESGIDVNELRPIRTQSELLSRYWAYRVAGTGGDLREHILRLACELMIQARRLRTERQRLVEPGSASALGELLSSQVLVEWQPPGASGPLRHIVSFSHNILFDFAASQLFLPKEPEDLARLLAADPDLSLMIRPSVVMHYQQLWGVHRNTFWALLFRVCGDAQIPFIGKLIGAAVVAESGRTLQDFEPLQQAFRSGTSGGRTAAETAFRLLVGALTAGPLSVFAGSVAGPYCELLRGLTQIPHELIAGCAQTLLNAILEHQPSLTEDQFLSAGNAARNLLGFAWSQERRNSWLVIHSLRSVCSTFRTDVTASAALLRRSIGTGHLATYGFEEMPWVARKVLEIAPHDPELVSDIYAAIFGYDEPSRENTDISGSRILSLISNRRQDYDHAKWQLGQSYTRFAQCAPIAAARAMARVIDAYASKEHHSDSSSPATGMFEINGQQASISTDYSCIWDRSGASHSDNEVGILNGFFRHLEELIQRPEESETVDQILAALIHDSKPAVIWARLLRLGALHPVEFGIRLRSLAWAEPVLRSKDTEDDAADFIGAVFPLLSAQERVRVETTILSFPQGLEEQRKKIAERDRARMLGRLSFENLVTSEAKQLVEELRQASPIPESTPRGPRLQVSAFEMNDRRFVEDVLGVSTEPESHRKFLEVLRPAQEFISRHSNKAPVVEGVDAALPSLDALGGFLRSFGCDVDPKLIALGCGTLAAAARAIAHVEELSCGTAAGQFARSILLEMSRRPEPEYDPARDAAFDEHLSWGAPIARIEAAEGLILLARHNSCCGIDVLEAIERLGRDQAAQVRYQIASNLTCLYDTAQERMWDFLEERIQTETSNAVLSGLANCLNRLAGRHADRSAGLSQRIFGRVHGDPRAKMPREVCLHTLAGLYIWRNHIASKEIVYKTVRDVHSNYWESSVVLSDLRGPLTHDSAEPPDTVESEVRMRAVELFQTVTVAVCEAFAALFARSRTPGWSESDAGILKEIARLVDHSATELYFASGVFNHGQAQPSITRMQQERFYRELTPTIDALITVGLPSAIHHLIEMLEAFVPVDPRKVFLHVSALVESGRRGDYQYESLAVDHIVRIIERYLAEYRPMLQEDTMCRIALRKTLDIFVEAGWPAAQQVSYHLDEIFR